MFGSIFRYKGTLWHVLNNITDVLGLSLLWALCCVPVVTVGAATTALYDTVVRSIRYGGEERYRRFFRTFKNELVTASLSTLLWGGLAAVGIIMLRRLADMSIESFSAGLAAYAYFFVLMLILGISCWAFTILSRFSFSFGALNLTALKFTFAHLPTTIIMVGLTVGALYLSIRYILALLAAPAMLMLLWSFFVERVFAKHGGGISPEAKEEDPGELEQD